MNELEEKTGNTNGMIFRMNCSIKYEMKVHLSTNFAHRHTHTNENNHNHSFSISGPKSFKVIQNYTHD